MPIARDNRFLDGTVRVGTRAADFAGVRVRTLAFMALRDHLVPHASATPIERLLPNADVERFEIDSGHVALLVGARAQGKTLPALHDWLTSDAHRPRKESRNGRAPATHP